MAKTVKKTTKRRARKRPASSEPPKITVAPDERVPFGRPSEYDPAYCDLVLELGKDGKSRAQIAAALDCSRQTLANWEEKHPDFMDAMTRARDLSLAWWEGAGQKGIWLGGSGFNANAFSLQIRNRFPDDYRDRKDVGINGGANGVPVAITINRQIVDPPDRGEG